MYWLPGPILIFAFSGVSAYGGNDNEALFIECFSRAKRLVEAHYKQRLDVSHKLAAKPLQEAQLWGFHPFAFFRRESNTIVMDVNRGLEMALQRARTRKDVADLITLFYVHELVHAYQATVLRERNNKLPSRQWTRFFCEGHAITWTVYLARTMDVSDEVLLSIRPSKVGQPTFTGVLAEDRAVLQRWFFYELSHLYVQSLGNGGLAFRAVLEAPIDYRVALGGNPRIKSQTAKERSLEGLLNQLKFRVEKPGAEVDYLEAALLVCPPVFLDRETCLAYCSGRLFAHSGDPSLEVLLFEFRDSRSLRFSSAFRKYAAQGPKELRRSFWQFCDGSSCIVNFPIMGQSAFYAVKDRHLILIFSPGTEVGTLSARGIISSFLKGSCK